jgi:hypothetical protein
LVLSEWLCKQSGAIGKGEHETVVEDAAFEKLFASSANIQAISEMDDKRGREGAIDWRKGKIPTYTTWLDRRPHFK